MKSRFCTAVMIASLLWLMCGTNPVDPIKDPNRAVISPVSINGDTTFAQPVALYAGKSAGIGFSFTNPQCIDSVIFLVKSTGATSKRIPPWSDTLLTQPFTFSEGVVLLQYTVYRNNNSIFVNQLVFDVTTPPTNHTPVITVTGDTSLHPLETCTLTIHVSDQDAGQLFVRSMSGNPDGAAIKNDSLFVWTVPAGSSGEYGVTFLAMDNGIPPLSGSLNVKITVSSDTANHPPKWNPDVLAATTGDTASYALDLAAMCSDPDSDQLTYSLLPGAPAKDTVVGSRYSFKATPEAIGKYTVSIVAADPQGARDTLILTLTVESKASDTTAPVMTLVAPAKDSGLSTAPTYMVDVICSDASGVASVCATVDGTTVPATRTEGHFTMAVSGLQPNVYTTITITATDSSAKTNKSTKVIFVKYNASFTLVYSGNGSIGGTVPVDTARYQAGAQVTVKANTGNLLKTGSTFTGWNSAADGSGASYDGGTNFVMGAANDTLFAKWTQKATYALTVSATNGSVTKVPDLAVYDSGAVATLKPVPAAHYHFTGWSGDATGTADSTMVVMSAAKSITANFAPVTYQLTVSAGTGGGGTISAPSSPATVNYGAETTITALPGSGYSFSGWVVTSGSAVIFDLTSATTTVTLTSGNAEIKAQWTAIPYPITYTLNGGQQAGGIYPATFTVNTSAITLPEPTKTAYVFDGWYDNSGFSGSKVTSIPMGSTGNKTFFAKWAIKDIDGNYYTEVKIGNQYWMVENLKTTKYNNGQAITYISQASEWENKPEDAQAYCWCFNDPSLKRYGAYYTVPVATGGKIAPDGWHVADSADFELARSYIESNYQTFTPNVAGHCTEVGTFYLVDTLQTWLFSRKIPGSSGTVRVANWNKVDRNFEISLLFGKDGASIRCVRDE